MDSCHLDRLLWTRGIKENNGRQGRIAGFCPREGLASFSVKVPNYLPQTARVQPDSYIRDVLDPACDISRALCLLLRAQPPCGAKEQGIVLHEFFLPRWQIQAEKGPAIP